MQFFRSNIPNLILRWLTSAAVLFYVLVPQVGICRCGDCSGCKSETLAVTETVKTESCCCCQETQASQTQTPPQKTQTAVRESRQTSNHGCPCTLKPQQERDRMVQTPVVSVERSGGELQDSFFAVADFTAQTFIVLHSSLVHSCNGWFTALAVRLHLFLLVLLI